MYSVNPAKLLHSYWQNRQLIKQLVHREIAGRYQGTYLGFLWVILDPLLMLAIYTFVFRIIFNRHWYSADESIIEFGLILFSGLLVFNIFRETITNAPRLIIRNTNYIKKIVFPLEVLSFVSIISNLIHLCIGLLLLLAIYLVINVQLHVAVLYLPLILFPFVIILLGTSYILSSLGVYFRDIGQIIGLVVMAVLFLSAIFYPIESVPEQYRIWFYMNPVAFTVEEFRDALIWGRSPHWQWLSFYYAISMIVGWLGLFWFQKTRKGFADVL